MGRRGVQSGKCEAKEQTNNNNGHNNNRNNNKIHIFPQVMQVSYLVGKHDRQTDMYGPIRHSWPVLERREHRKPVLSYRLNVCRTTNGAHVEIIRPKYNKKTSSVNHSAFCSAARLNIHLNLLHHHSFFRTL